MKKIEEQVRDDVARLLGMICSDKTDPDSYEFVLSRLTRMAIVGTAPPSCTIRNGQAGRTAAPGNDYRDYSEEKERWIAR